jgi:drug/metabolite transporter (DMT)-like permease
VPDTSGQPRRLIADIASLVVCSLIWGVTWRAIKLQLGVVPPLESVVYRFALASAVLFGLCIVTGRSLLLGRRQHLEVALQGLSGFCLQYAFVYLAEQTVSSGAMAVIFASIAFVNLILFRLLMGRRAPPLAWGATLLGLAGVAAMSVSEAHGPAGGAGHGVLLALAGVLVSVLANMFAARAQEQRVPLLPGTAWAMAYGAGLLGLYLALTGAHWRIETSLRYLGSLAFLSLFGSVIAFLTFYALARRRGYTFASYISALTPPTAMVLSALTEDTRWGPAAGLGLVLVLAGQVLLIRASPKS